MKALFFQPETILSQFRVRFYPDFMFYLREINNFLKNQFLEARGITYFQKLLFRKSSQKILKINMDVGIS